VCVCVCIPPSPCVPISKSPISPCIGDSEAHPHLADSDVMPAPPGGNQLEEEKKVREKGILILSWWLFFFGGGGGMGELLRAQPRRR